MKQQNKIKEHVRSLKMSYFGLMASMGLLGLAFYMTSVSLMWIVAITGACMLFIYSLQMAVTIEDLSKTTIEEQRTRTSKSGKNEK